LLLAGTVLFALGVSPGNAQKGEIGALCRLEPADGLLELAVAAGGRVASIRVTAGDFVKRGTVLVTSSAFNNAQADVKEAEAALERRKAFAQARIEAQAQAVKAREAEAAQANDALKSYIALGGTATSEKEKRQRQYAQQAAQAQLAQARALLEVERAEAAAMIDAAHAALRTTRLQLVQSAIVAPIDGEVLDVRRQVGESLGHDPVVIMGDLRRMQAVCEVFEGDLVRIQPGSAARVESNALPKPVQGSVTYVGKLVNGDTRLGKAIISLEDSAAVSRQVGMQVQATIAP
jgi:multidrug resistance efflux pump